MDESATDFTPRAYQIDLYERAVNENTIIYLPTGSGKTYITVMLIKKYSSQLQLPYDKGGKRIVFIVNTVPLVSEQSNYIARHTGLICRGYSGDMAVDNWSKEDWLTEIRETQVMVMVGDIFLNALNHGNMLLNTVCLLIFDECHKAVGHHPMRNIMKCFERYREQEHPRVLGLTATLLNANFKVEKVEAAIRELEITFHARIATVNSADSVREYGNLRELFTFCKPPDSYGIEDKLKEIFNHTITLIDAMELKDSFDADMSKELRPKSRDDKLRNMVEDAMEHVQSTGLYGGSKAVLMHMIQLESIKKYTDDTQTVTVIEFIVTQMMKMRKLMKDRMNSHSELEQIQKFSSDQLLKTLSVLRDFSEKKTGDQKFCCIIFVRRRTTAQILYHVLKNLRQLDRSYEFLLPEYVVGCSNNSYKNPREALYVSKWNKEALRRFRSGQTNCIVATDVVDEGVDIPACTLIVRYDLPADFRDYIQSKSRARDKNGLYAMIIPQTDTTFMLKCQSYRRVEKFLKEVSLTLPLMSPLKKRIDGELMGSIVLAKPSAALKTCKELHKIQEHTDHLLPAGPKAILNNADHLFPNWVDEPKAKAALAGTAVRKRRHNVTFPRSLYAAFPTSEKPLYLHIIKAKPTYPRPYENRRMVFYDLLNDDAGFGILSTKSMPDIPSFPIFMDVGDLNVSVKVNHSKFSLSAKAIAELRLFHWVIFHKVLNVVNKFMAFDDDNRSNSFLIVPTDKRGKINWHVVKTYTVVQEVPSAENINILDYQLALVRPNYKSASSVYVVTRIRDDILAESSLPIGDFYSYVHYYKARHGLIIRDCKQPMLEVRAISKSINWIRPRCLNAGPSERKRAELPEDFQEHFVGELCNRIVFPALYWLKASYLPSVLHRVCQLLVAEELRIKIVKEARLGVTKLQPGSSWPPLVVKQTDIEETFDALLDISGLTADDSVLSSEPEVDIPGPEIDALGLESKFRPWTNDQEPVNLFKDIEQIQLIDIEHYHQFMTTPMDTGYDILKNQRRSHKFEVRPKVKAPLLDILSKEDRNGPSPVFIMQALTGRQSNDAFNLERLETLGDSCLKFAVSIYLFEAYSMCNEGQLTIIKSKIIGNRNLFYCGNKKQIPGRMKVDDFVPTSNFKPPSYCVLRSVQQQLLKDKIAPNVLYELNIPPNEQFTGSLSDPTMAVIQERVSSWNDTDTQTEMQHFLNVQIVPDKSVSDSVEALIGVYLSSMGLFGAFKILMWFGILPSKLVVNDILCHPPESSRLGVGNPDEHMPQATYIENQIGYKFKDRGYLLQAFTHPSYTPNNITPSYERLEFLGDALLDFLITVHIYESCDYLTPGTLTDLRSALVNNITFACLAVKYGFHTALLSYAPKLQESIERFVKFQDDRDYAVDDELLWILLEEEECKMAEYVDVPKILGDLFESVIGAIYLDSGKDLNKVWEIVYSLMHKEITAFSKNVPKQPIRVIHETPGAQARLSKSTVVEGTDSMMVTLEVVIAGKQKIFHGFGANKKQAKCAAAKQALKCIRSNVSV